MLNIFLSLLAIFSTLGAISRRLNATAGQYEPKPRNLPDDQLILETFLKIQDPVLRRMYALMAVFGLRNHEVLVADVSPLQRGEYYVSIPEDTKTGEREAWALYPEWIEEFGLREPSPFTLPDNPTRGQLGKLVTSAFKDAKIPFVPYDLRHCWARRSIGQLDPRLSAASLGHSLEKHYKTYNRWFTYNDTKQAYNRLLEDPNRLRPPKPSTSESVS